MNERRTCHVNKGGVGIDLNTQHGGCNVRDYICVSSTGGADPGGADGEEEVG